MSRTSQPILGVVVVTYQSDDVIEQCLESLIAAQDVELRIVVVDNASKDETCDRIRATAARAGLEPVEIEPVAESGLDVRAPRLALINGTFNRGYAGGVNLGLRHLMQDSEINDFWVLNPDCIVLPQTASAYVAAAHASPGYGMLGGRTLYYGEGRVIQSDGGRINRWTGVCSNVNFGKSTADAQFPSSKDIDYLSGANFVVSRQFIERVGLMSEDYFLYYEEVDWAMRRGSLPIVLTDRAVVLHHAGTSIGSGTKSRAHTPFSNYFNFRARMIFMRKFRPFALPVSYLFSLAKIIQTMIKVGRREAAAAFRGLHGLPPPPDAMRRLDQGARQLVLGMQGRMSD